MRERLANLICEATNNNCVGMCHLKSVCDRCQDTADHLLANGVIVPPCKVGQTVYKVVADKRVKKPYECKVVGVWYAEDEFANDVHLARYVNGMFDCSFSVQFKEFGKTVFLTKEEAEQALRKDEGK